MNDYFPGGVSFFKMQGCGNDFIVVDNRELGLDPAKMPEWAVKVCKRAFGVYADGIFFLDESDQPGEDFRWRFFNSDGSRAEMCGNASRCAGKLAPMIGLAGKSMVFGTDAGPIRAEVLDDASVKVQLTAPGEPELGFDLDLDGERIECHFVNTGVPHAVVFVDDVAAIDVPALGRAVREHGKFAPAGTNVNFVQVLDDSTMLLRTYERGVEDETYACGTGAAASHLIANTLGKVGPQTRITTSGGETLTLGLFDGQLFLTGAAEITFAGKINPMALDLP